jgi:predicted AAA+ superfamily ATPase
MGMNIRANELINSDIYVREPVDKYKNKINNSESNKVILTGGRGTGKSVVLNELQQRGLGTNNQTVLMRYVKYQQLRSIKTMKVVCFDKKLTP